MTSVHVYLLISLLSTVRTQTFKEAIHLIYCKKHNSEERKITVIKNLNNFDFYCKSICPNIHIKTMYNQSVKQKKA